MVYCFYNQILWSFLLLSLNSVQRPNICQISFFSYSKIKVETEKQREVEIEDRKDKRTQIQATQQSQMIDQRNNTGVPIDFEQGAPGVGQAM